MQRQQWHVRKVSHAQNGYNDFIVNRMVDEQRSAGAVGGSGSGRGARDPRNTTSGADRSGRSGRSRDAERPTDEERKIAERGKPSRAARPEAEMAKIIILGTEATGKTSIFKQLRRFCGAHAVSDEELRRAKLLCVEHVLRVLQQLATESINLTVQGHKSTQVSEANNTLLARFAGISVNRETFWTQKMLKSYKSGQLRRDIEQFIRDPGINSTAGYIKKSIMTNAEWFLHRLDQYFDPDYVPDFDDYVRLHNERGIYDEVSSISNSWNLSITDCCGARSQRTLWASAIHPNYTAMVFVASLADFDQYRQIGEKLRVNCLIESMELLQSLVHTSYFRDTNVILILNMNDVFDRKLQDYHVSFAQHFPLHLCERFHHDNWLRRYPDTVYDESHDVRKHFARLRKQAPFTGFAGKKEFDPTFCTEFVKQQFRNILPPATRKTMRIYITCATASDTFRFVLQTMTQEVVHMEQMRRVRKKS